MKKIQEQTLISLLAVIIAISGSFKIPGPLPGTEFQLSAPIAVAIAAVFGFKRYIAAGIIASVVTVILGTHTIVNVMIAMVFRITVGGMIYFFKPKVLPVTLAGPLGTIAARVMLCFLFKNPITVMIAASLPGMLYTAVAAWPLSRLLSRLKEYTPWKEIHYEGKSI